MEVEERDCGSLLCLYFIYFFGGGARFPEIVKYNRKGVERVGGGEEKVRAQGREALRENWNRR